MVKKLHVGNLAYGVSEESLKSAFSQFGTVESAVVIKDRVSGRSKGFGFVEMSSDAEASEAIEKMNKAEFEGRTMFVSESRYNGAPAGGGSNRQKPSYGGGFRNDRRSPRT
jgi:RNA recognition motif-containing protein